MFAQTFAGLFVTDEQLREAAISSGVLKIDDDYLDPDFRKECQK